MSKVKTSFVCRECGAVAPRWSGRCLECGTWDAMETFTGSDEGDSTRAAPGESASAPALPLHEVSALEVPRIPSGIGEFDRTLGGGIVPGSVILVGGDPGIGKSTLLLQAFSALAASGHRVLYASSEESAQQVKLRAERICPGANSGANASDNLYLIAETSVARITNEARRVKASLLAIDSIQLVQRHDADALPGSMTQLRRCCLELVQFAKSSGTAVLLVGHVTKEGDLAGPKLLEHLVDVVLSFEGDRHHAFRLVRATKNRYGSTHEIGLFEMTGDGLAEVDESALAAANAAQPRPGTAIVPVMAGSRVLLAEIQALVAAGFLGNAKRKASGMDSGRLSMMIAVLEKHGGLRLADQDIYTSVAGGMRIVEPAADLAACLAIAGAHLGRALPPATAVLGEVGLSGELRPMRTLEQRISEATRRGCTTIVIPASQQAAKRQPGAELIEIHSIAQALDLLSPARSTPDRG